jgi:drug/metabolite transporter (DMT)-like permease
MVKLIKTSAITEWAAFFILSVLSFGSSFFWIKLALQDLTPLELVTYRCLIAALFLWSCVWWFKIPFPKTFTKNLQICFAAILGGALPNTLIAWGMIFIDSSVASILVALSPLFTILIGFFTAVRSEITVRKILVLIALS